MILCICPRSFQKTVVIISRVPLIVADILLICITWIKLNSRSALKGIQQSRRLSLSDILFRDGASLLQHWHTRQVTEWLSVFQRRV